MQDLVQANGNDFDAKDRQAKEAVEAADSTAWTIRDKGAANRLSFYLSETEDGRRDTEMRALMQRRKIHWTDEELEMEKKLDALNVQTRLASRSAVLKVLH